VEVRKESGLGGFPCKIPSKPDDYEHSPANYYICGERGDYPVTNYLGLDDMDFSNQVI